MNNKATSLDILSRLDFFKENPRLFFFYKKAEKLSSVIHIISNVLNESEPIRTKLRMASLELVHTVLYETISLSRNEKALISVKILEMLALLEVAAFGGFISKMNFQILRDEYFNLLSLGSINFRGIEESISIEPLFFDIGMPETFKKSSPNELKEQYRGHNVFYNKPAYKGQMPPDSASLKGQSLSNRVIVILRIIKDKGNVGVKDIAQLITNVSEKTIQRDLINLVSRGVLKKRGKRRWSRYFL